MLNRHNMQRQRVQRPAVSETRTMMVPCGLTPRRFGQEAFQGRIAAFAGFLMGSKDDAMNQEQRKLVTLGICSATCQS